MAVQAQFPSNILLLNRNGQEGGHDYPLQPQPGGFLDHPSQILSATNYGGNSSRGKRGREEFVTASGGGMATIHQFTSSTQPHSQQQLIDLSQLHNNGHHQSNVISTGLRLSFGHQQQQQQQSSNASISTLSEEDFSAQIKRHRYEMDHFLHAQGEQLRRMLAEKRQGHYRALLSAAEDSISRRLREKESEVEKATRRNAELEARAAQLSVEVQVWQAKARAQETMATSLQEQLDHAIMSGSGRVPADNRRGDDRLGCSGGVEGQAEDAESAYVDPERVSLPSGPSCKGCRKKAATVVMFPCWHLCLCRDCDQRSHACPLCLQVRNSSIEVFLC